VWQPPGHAHSDSYRDDYSQLYAPVDRRAQRDGVEVDLVEELVKGAPELLGGRLPSWLEAALT